MENKKFFKYKRKYGEHVDGAYVRNVCWGVVLADDSTKAFDRVQEWLSSSTTEIEKISICPIPDYDGNGTSDIDKDTAIVTLKEKIIKDK